MGFYKDDYEHWQVEWQPYARKYTISEPKSMGNLYVPELDEALFTLPEAFAWIENFYKTHDAETAEAEGLRKVRTDEDEEVFDDIPDVWVDHDYTPRPRRYEDVPVHVTEAPPRVLTGNDLVVNPISSQTSSRASRMEEYGARVGFQR